MPFNTMLNQLYRQKENIDNMIAQYSAPQAPVQNIINTSNSNSDTDIRFLGPNDDISNIIISKKTVFVDEPKAKISIKEVDGTISKSYDIIIPKDEKDLKIEELEKKILELEERVNDKSTESTVTNDAIKATTTGASKPIKSATITTF